MVKKSLLLLCVMALYNTSAWCSAESKRAAEVNDPIKKLMATIAAQENTVSNHVPGNNHGEADLQGNQHSISEDLREKLKKAQQDAAQNMLKAALVESMGREYLNNVSIFEDEKRKVARRIELESHEKAERKRIITATSLATLAGGAVKLGAIQGVQDGVNQAVSILVTSAIVGGVTYGGSKLYATLFPTKVTDEQVIEFIKKKQSESLQNKRAQLNQDTETLDKLNRVYLSQLATTKDPELKAQLNASGTIIHAVLFNNLIKTAMLSGTNLGAMMTEEEAQDSENKEKQAEKSEEKNPHAEEKETQKDATPDESVDNPIFTKPQASAA